MLVALVGGSSFIGSALARALVSDGHTVICYSRSEPSYDSEHRAWTLGESPTISPDCEAVFHLAWDRKTPPRKNQSVSGLHLAMREFSLHGISKQWFISSYSASEFATSFYGREKWKAEQYATALGVGIIRPGLVIGDGGIYGSIQRFARACRIIPIPRGYEPKIPVIALDGLTRSMVDLLHVESETTIHKLYDRNFHSLRSLITMSASANKKRPIFLRVPFIMLFSALYLSSKLRLPVGVSADSLRSLTSTHYREEDTS